MDASKRAESEETTRCRALKIRANTWVAYGLAIRMLESNKQA